MDWNKTMQNQAWVHLRIQLSSILPPSTAPTFRQRPYLIEGDLQSLSPYADGKVRAKEYTYQVHNFDENVHSLTVSGADARAFTGPSLHGKHITLSSHDSQLSLPPSGVFDWHYLQCVICRFGTSAYKSSPFTQF
jgi:hypothetical protein